ncbi:hypothetical protein MMC25_007745 [Agyrium rufum]|nr:hypothetical protein [Agyrium rufum]
MSQMQFTRNKSKDLATPTIKEIHPDETDALPSPPPTPDSEPTFHLDEDLLSPESAKYLPPPHKHPATVNVLHERAPGIASTLPLRTRSPRPCTPGPSHDGQHHSRWERLNSHGMPRAASPFPRSRYVSPIGRPPTPDSPGREQGTYFRRQQSPHGGGIRPESTTPWRPRRRHVCRWDAQDLKYVMLMRWMEVDRGQRLDGFSEKQATSGRSHSRTAQDDT